MAKVWIPIPNGSNQDVPPGWIQAEGETTEYAWGSITKIINDKTSQSARQGTPSQDPIFTDTGVGGYVPPKRTARSKVVRIPGCAVPIMLFSFDDYITDGSYQLPRDLTGRTWELGYQRVESLPLIDTTVKKFGAGSMKEHDLGNGMRLGNFRAAPSSDFALSTEDFQIAVWIESDGTAWTTEDCMFSIRSAEDSREEYFLFSIQDVSDGVFYVTAMVTFTDYSHLTLTFPSVSGGEIFNIGEFNHVTFYRRGNIFGIGINGKEVASAESNKEILDMSAMRAYLFYYWES